MVEITAPVRAAPGMLKNGARILAVSGGVQSTTLAWMIKDGVLPPVDVAIFADTGNERPESLTVIDICPSISRVGGDKRPA